MAGLLDSLLLNMYTSHAQDSIAKVLLSSSVVRRDLVVKAGKQRSGWHVRAMHTELH